MNAEGSIPEPIGTLPTTGEIYHLIDNTGNQADYQTRIAAIDALGESRDPRAVTTLSDCCRDGNTGIRKHAVEALARVKSVRSVPVLMEVLQNKDDGQEIRLAAIQALSEIRVLTTMEGLIELSLDTDEDPAIRVLAARMLGQMK